MEEHNANERSELHPEILQRHAELDGRGSILRKYPVQPLRIDSGRQGHHEEYTSFVG